MNISRDPLASTAPGICSYRLEQFCERMLADVSLQDKLRESTATDDFIALVVQIARELGIDLKADEVRAGMRGSLPGAAGLLEGTLRETPLPPEDWLPVRAAWHAGRLYVHWSYFGDRRLREPFFEGDVQRALFKPFNRLFRYVTPIEKLAGWLQAHPGLRPNGFIFHMSRCGSTLVSQMLAALPQNIVISEADSIDAVVRARQVRPDLSEDQQALWLTWMIGALGQPRGGERHYFIKLDCWHTLALPLFRRAFPDVPWVFLYRDPVEVLVSQMKMPGLQMIPGALGADLFDIALSDYVQSPEDYCARVLAKICEPVLGGYSKDKTLLVNYTQLPPAVSATIMPHFVVDCSDADRAAMAEAARFDAKTPSFEFAADIDSKQRNATEAIRAAADERLGELYRRLEALRLNA